jgi:hypothetical protein
VAVLPLLACKTYPKFYHELVLVDLEHLAVALGKLADGEGPAVKTGTKGNGALVWVDLDITEGLVKVCGNDDVHGLDDTGEILVQVFLGELQFEESAIDLVDDDNGLDTLTESLSEHSLGLHAHAFDGVDDDEGAVSDTEGSGDFGGEINVTGRVNQVDQELVLLNLLGDILKIFLLGKLSVQGDGRRLDGDTTFLLVGASVRKPGLSSLCCRDNTGTLNEGIGEGGFSVVDCGPLLESGGWSMAADVLPRKRIWGELTMGNDGHVTDVGGMLHERTDLMMRVSIQA